MVCIVRIGNAAVWPHHLDLLVEVGWGPSLPIIMYEAPKDAVINTLPQHLVLERENKNQVNSL